VRFLIDAQLPPLLAALLVDRGYEAAHVYDRGGASATDSAIWTIALDEDWVIVTKDQDFAQRVGSSAEGPAVVWVRLGNCGNADLLDCVGVNWLRTIDRLRGGDRLVELK